MRTVLLCALDHLVDNRNSELAAGDDVAAIVNAGPDTRLRRSLAERRKRFRIARKQIAEHPGGGDRSTSVRRRIAWVVGRGE